MRLLRNLLLILLPVFLLSSCKHAPQVTVCISDPRYGGMDCYDQASGKSSFINYIDSDKFVCFNPIDAQLLLNYCASGKQ